MEFFVVADRDTVLGFGCLGIPGAVVETARDVEAQLDRLVQEEAEMIVITTEQVAGLVRDRISAIRFGERLPLIVEVPGPEGPSEEGPSLLKLIRDAVGIKF
jgi:vacuolar-type H+-ATPase subunit F/Vma7